MPHTYQRDRQDIGDESGAVARPQFDGAAGGG